MEYTVQKLAKLAGISCRTLRYYDAIGLLKPARTTPSGYRLYGQKEIDLLQQILFYRELGMDLTSIRRIVTMPSFDGLRALHEHRAHLLAKRTQLDLLIANVNKSIAMAEGGSVMSDSEKFEGFKRQLIEENERKYGEEIRGKYGREAVKQANQKMQNMIQAEYGQMTAVEQELFQTLREAMDSGDPAGEAARKAAELHRRWLSYSLPAYTGKIHAGLARMYTADDRFRAYYDDRVRPGAAQFLSDAILAYTDESPV